LNDFCVYFEALIIDNLITPLPFVGDEFTIMLPETNLIEAIIIANRLLANFSQDFLTIDEK